MLKEILFAALYVTISFIAAFVFFKIQKENLPLYASLLVSLAFAISGLAMLKYSSLPLLQQSAVITVSSRLGYLIGLIYAGETISSTQIVGVFIMIFGSILTNNKS